MRTEALNAMTDEELEQYARTLGFTTKAAKSHDAKVRLIAKRRERGVDVSALGVDLRVPVRAAHDLRFTQLISKPDRTDDDIETAMTMLLGDEQMGALREAATEDDGTVDQDALAFAYTRILSSDELKNF